MIVTLMVLLIAIGSVCAGTDGSLLSDGEDFDDNDGDDFEFDDSGSGSDDEDDDWDDDGSGSDDEDDDWDDDGSGSDDEDDDWDDDGSDSEDFDGEAGGAFELTASSFDLSNAKGMNMKDESYSSADSQNSMGVSPQAGNPIFVLLLSLMFLLAIPLRNR